MPQAKGSAAQLVRDKEASYKTLKAAAVRQPVKMHFNTNGLTFDRNLVTPATLRGDRNPVDPIQGNKTVTGDIVVPVDMNQIGYWIDSAMSVYTRTESPVSIEDGAGTVTIAGGTGAYTFSVAQTIADVGDRVIYLDANGNQIYAFITTETNTTTGILSLERDGATVAPNTVGAVNIDAIVNNKGNAAIGTYSIVNAADIATLTLTAVPDVVVVVGDMIIGDITGTEKRFIVKTITSTTVFTVEDEYGFPPATDAGPTEVDSIEVQSQFVHTWKIGDIASVPSEIYESGFTDITVDDYFANFGCKTNSIAFNWGGDEEMTATVNIIGADSTETGTPYDDGASPPAQVRTFNRLNQFQVTAKEGSPLAEILNLKTFALTLNNQLDADQFAIGGLGVRRDLPEGIAEVSGSLTATFEDNTLTAKAKANTETGFEITITSGSDTLVFQINEAKIQVKDPEIGGPAGVELTPDWSAYYDNHSGTSALIVILTNTIHRYS